MNWWIFTASLNLLAAMLHVGIILGGPSWYRFFGAGEQLASLAERRHPWPGILTGMIALVFISWAAICLALAGVLSQLPLLIPAAWAITLVYTLRGIAPFLVMPWVKAVRTLFWFWSSVICAGFALVHWLALLNHH